METHVFERCRHQQQAITALPCMMCLIHVTKPTSYQHVMLVIMQTFVNFTCDNQSRTKTPHLSISYTVAKPLVINTSTFCLARALIRAILTTTCEISSTAVSTNTS